ncbi:hypothetical protein V9K67_00645 [Paraflavisolibacter sp. H34]|uniref:hypothetical protein n=1 Tax=Huijunlia imazamoxiresistens TaxID=3127457 RepID=UPI003015EAD5
MKHLFNRIYAQEHWQRLYREGAAICHRQIQQNQTGDIDPTYVRFALADVANR